uniref:ABC-type phosphate transport system, periplasmic component n=1 Tax=Desulfovibrio sp. U5L TaxID=596152 RepID=I2Q4J2_9BACT
MGRSKGRPGTWLAWVVLACLVLAGGSARAADGQGRLVVTGTGDSEVLLRHMAALFLRRHPDAAQAAIEVPDAVGTSGGLKAVLAGQAELARTARPLRDEEKAAGLAETVFATAPIVFAVNPSVTGLRSLTADQALAVFSGRVRDWSELGAAPSPIYPVCRKTPETSRDRLDATIPGFADLDCRNQAVAYSTPEAVSLVATHPGTIGYFTLPAMAGTPLRPLAFEGVAPTPENLGRGAYPLSVPFGLAYKPPLGPAAARFLAALGQADARALLAQFGCLPGDGKPAAP